MAWHKCRFCGKKQNSLDNLNRHEEELHRGDMLREDALRSLATRSRWLADAERVLANSLEYQRVLVEMPNLSPAVRQLLHWELESDPYHKGSMWLEQQVASCRQKVAEAEAALAALTVEKSTTPA